MLALSSAWARRFALILVVFSVAVSVALLLLVAQIRTDARTSFSNAVSGVDLIVGPRGSASELLMYSVFQLGRPTRNMSAKTEEEVAGLAGVSWVVPLQLGDSYRGHAVWGTRPDLFTRLKVRAEPLQWAQGRAFLDPREAGVASVFELVLGADLAQTFNHGLGDQIVLTHGSGGPLAQQHSQTPFTVVGILKPTGGPIDRAALVSLEGFEAIHLGWGMGQFQGLGGRLLGNSPMPKLESLQALRPSELTSLLVGLESRSQVFAVRRAVESISREPLMAVLPGVALDDLWRVLAVGENSLLLVGGLVALASVLSVSAVLLVSLSVRRREFAVLRAIGARPSGLLLMVLLESMLVCGIGLVCGFLLQQTALLAAADWMRVEFGIVLEVLSVPTDGWLALVGILTLSTLASLFPALRAYQMSLQDGLNPPHA
ncbi:ABC transporter permease protein domain containing protein [Burkholderiales bacterium]